MLWESWFFCLGANYVGNVVNFAGENVMKMAYMIKLIILYFDRKKGDI